MTKYRSVQVSFWQDSFVLDLTPEEKYFYLYLMTNPKATQIGIYELPLKVMELETGYNRETVVKLLNRFVDYKKVVYSNETKEIMLLNWVKHNWNTSPKVITRVNIELKNIKEENFIKLYHDAVKEVEHNPDKINLLYGIDTVSIDYGYKEKEKEKEKEKDKEGGSVSQNDVDHLMQVHSELGYGIAGANAYAIFRRLLDKGVAAEVIERAYQIGADDNKRNQRYINGILKNWEVDGVKTLKDLENRENKRVAAIKNKPTKELNYIDGL